MRVVLDTNIIVSSFLSPKGISAKILDSARAGLFELVVSEAILTEYEEALSKGAVRVRHGLTPRKSPSRSRDFVSSPSSSSLMSPLL
jgi:putative PIN family toxin of toxin-antitoxin system